MEKSALPQFQPRRACSLFSSGVLYQFLKTLLRRSKSSCWNPSSWMIVDELRCRMRTSYPLDALLQCALPMLLWSRVKVSPPLAGFQPKPVSANLHFPLSLERSR